MHVALTSSPEWTTAPARPEPDARAAVGTGPLAPASLRAAIEDLAYRMRRAGLSITLHLDDLPDHPELTGTAYRIAHAALCNAARFAPASRVTITMAQAEAGFEMSVIDDCSGPARSWHAPELETGACLADLAGRLAALGGSLHAGPLPGGGFAIAARIPLPSEPA